LNLNTSDFNIQVSTDGTNFQTVANVTDNVQSITTHDIPATAARYVRLNVLPSSGGSPEPANIYEFQVFAANGPTTKSLLRMSRPERFNRLVPQSTNNE
jgi:hypothetical protein